MLNFIEELRWRNMLHDMTPGIEELLNSKKVVGYIGFDPTAPSMTIGNFVQIMLLKLFQLSGHTPIVLMGGATGRIGDPSFKEKERELKSYDELDSNLAFQKEQIKKFLDFEGQNAAIIVNNHDFYNNMNVLDFLRDVGKTLTVSYMMSKDSVKNRLELQIRKIINRDNLYGFNFLYALVEFIDYPQLKDTQVKIIMESIYSEGPSISTEQQKKMFDEIMLDVADEPSKGKRIAYMKQSPYYNALQVKFNYAVT